MEEENRNLNQIKLIKGKHTYNSYKDMCDALNILPAKRGQEKERQIKEIEKYYKLKKNSDNTITLTYKTKKDKIKEERKKKPKTKRKGFIHPQILRGAKEEADKYKTIFINNQPVNIFNPYIFSEGKTKNGKVIPCCCEIDKYLLYFIKHHTGYTKSDYYYKFIVKTPILDDVLNNQREFLNQKCNSDATLYNLFNKEIVLFFRHFLFNRLNSLEKRGYVNIIRGFNYSYRINGEKELKYSYIELDHPLVKETLAEARKEFDLLKDNNIWLRNVDTIQSYNAFLYKTLQEKMYENASIDCYDYRIHSRCYMVELSPKLSKEFLDDIESTFNFNQNVQDVLTLAFQILRAKKRYNLIYRAKLARFHKQDRLNILNAKKLISLMEEFLTYRSLKGYELEDGTIKRDFRTLEELEEVRKLNVNSESEIEFENNIDDKERKNIVLYLEEMSESDAKELIEIDAVLEERNKENERYEESIGIDC